MAGGIDSGGVWAMSDDKTWVWVLGEPTTTAPGVTITPMAPLFDRDVYVCYVDGRRLEVSGFEIVNSEPKGLSSRIKPLPKQTFSQTEPDKPYVGFDNLPQPEYKTGWDDFDWSK